LGGVSLNRESYITPSQILDRMNYFVDVSQKSALEVYYYREGLILFDEDFILHCWYPREFKNALRYKIGINIVDDEDDDKRTRENVSGETIQHLKNLELSCKLRRDNVLRLNRQSMIDLISDTISPKRMKRYVIIGKFSDGKLTLSFYTKIKSTMPEVESIEFPIHSYIGTGGIFSVSVDLLFNVLKFPAEYTFTEFCFNKTFRTPLTLRCINDRRYVIKDGNTFYTDRLQLNMALKTIVPYKLQQLV
jgi:hypothetical protein